MIIKLPGMRTMAMKILLPILLQQVRWSSIPFMLIDVDDDGDIDVLSASI